MANRSRELLAQRFLTFFGLFPNIDLLYDRISNPTILVNANMRHFIDSPMGFERLTEHPNKLQLLYIKIHQSKNSVNVELSALM